MSHYRRIFRPGGYYFFTVVTYKRKKIFANPIARDCLKDVLNEVKIKQPFEIPAMCLLPEHIHCIWKMPEGDSDYSQRWSAIKSAFTRKYLELGGAETNQSVSRQKRRLRGIWQKRFWEHRIRDYDDLNNHADYIHWNPVKHKLVDKVGDWPWSTWHNKRWAGRYDSFDWDKMKEFDIGYGENV